MSRFVGRIHVFPGFSLSGSRPPAVLEPFWVRPLVLSRFRPSRSGWWHVVPCPKTMNRTNRPRPAPRNLKRRTVDQTQVAPTSVGPQLLEDIGAAIGNAMAAPPQEDAR